VKVQKKFKVFSNLNPWNSSKQTGHANVEVEIENKEENNLGMPFPAGKVRVYKDDGQSVEFVGEDMIDHTPKNEKITLKIGEAFDVIYELVETGRESIDKNVYDADYEYIINNRKEESIEVELFLNCYILQGDDFEVIDSNVEYDKIDSKTLRAVVRPAADSETKLTFKVRFKG
jgi:hypothetical protein